MCLANSANFYFDTYGVTPSGRNLSSSLVYTGATVNGVTDLNSRLEGPTTLFPLRTTWFIEGVCPIYPRTKLCVSEEEDLRFYWNPRRRMCRRTLLPRLALTRNFPDLFWSYLGSGPGFASSPDPREFSTS